MPLYRIKEKRCYTEVYVVRAEDEDAARTSHDFVETESESDSYADEILSIEEIAEEE